MTAGDAMLALLLHALAGSADGSREREHWDNLVRVVDGQGDGKAVGAAELTALRRKPHAASAETATRALLARSHDDESFRNDFSAWRSQEPIEAAERSLRDAAINDGTFVGSLLFWIVQKSLGWGPTYDDIEVINYLISQGADCTVPLSYLKYSLKIGSFTADQTGGLIPILQSCAR